MPDYAWKQMTGLTDEDRAIDLASISSLYESWRSAKDRLADSSKGQLKEFDALRRHMHFHAHVTTDLYPPKVKSLVRGCRVRP